MKIPYKRVGMWFSNANDTIKCPNCKGKSVKCDETGMFLCKECPLATRTYVINKGVLGY